jgi:hypothetical protein
MLPEASIVRTMSTKKNCVAVKKLSVMNSVAILLSLLAAYVAQ